jgi:outer membrane protein insertion porin family
LKYFNLILCLGALALFSLNSGSVYTQDDSLITLEDAALQLDSLNLTVNAIVITGNDVTKEEIILREMSLKKGSRFTYKKYSEDLLRIYNLALFTKVEIIPIQVSDKEVTVNVDVTERWYILPLPQGGIEDGEWKKIWVGLNLRWDNFRGRNERLNVGFRVFYNPAAGIRYQVPWIGEKLHLFTSMSLAWARTRNQSLSAVGRENGSGTLKYGDENYDNIQYRAELTIGKYLTKYFNVFTDFKYNYLRVTKFQPGRTLSADGIDRYLTVGAGISFDSRDLIEYPTKGDYLRTYYHRYGFIDKEINFGRYVIENQSFIPLDVTKTYYLTLASRIFTSLAVGAIIPVYNHEYLGYSEDYVRGWKRQAFEGDNVFTVYNELRIPILKPRYIKAKKLMIVKDLPIIKNLDLRHGVYFTMIYDIGTVWYKDENIYNKRFMSGAGIGVDIIAPFGYIFRTNWVFRFDRPVVGQLVFSIGAKF